MSRSTVEIDFFRKEKESTSSMSPPKKQFQSRRSSQDIQNIASKLSPEVVKNVIARFLVPSAPEKDHSSCPALPVCVPNSRPSFGSPNNENIAPLTIFYNGTVTVFDVSPDKAKNILKYADEAVSRSPESIDSGLFALSSSEECQLPVDLNGDLPIARKKSLERFLEKRKERHTTPSPYDFSSPTNFEFSDQNV